MLFNSYTFLFVFLPIAVIGFFALASARAGSAILWLAACSVVFYGWWDWQLTWVLAGSIAINYGCGWAITVLVAARRKAAARFVVWSIVSVDLLALAYFKYANFAVAVVSDSLSVPLAWTQVILPIGISFFTFTQIAFQVDAYQGKVREVTFLRYVLFVTYFPHLIAGPILHHADMMPQFSRLRTFTPSMEALSVGLTVFILGLFKKLLLADPLGSYADDAFLFAQQSHLTTPQAWRGVLAYTLQIYFDFSAYCDMAIGVSRMFNIQLPANFESPYKARSIKDFWRRWHMTLSRFLRDYLYIPLGGNRHGPARRYANLFATMVLGGLWHGAGWTFIVWGALHGFYLCVNHAWDAATAQLGPVPARWSMITSIMAWAVTFVSVMVAWVFFRAPDVGTATSILASMSGLQAGTGPTGIQIAQQGAKPLMIWLGGDIEQAVWLTAGLAVALFLPNVRQFMARHLLVLPGAEAVSTSTWVSNAFRWRPSLGWVAVTVGLFLISLSHMSRVSPFLYFQF